MRNFKKMWCQIQNLTFYGVDSTWNAAAAIQSQ